MSTSAENRPSAPSDSPAPPGAPDPGGGPTGEPRHFYRRRSTARPLVWGLGISALFHLFLLFIASRATLTVGPGTGGAHPSGSAGAGDAIPEMVSIRLRLIDQSESEATEEEPDTPPEAGPVTPRRSPVPPEAALDPEKVERAGEGAGAGQGRGKGDEVAPPTSSSSVLDRLRPGMADPRLWGRVEAPPPPEKTDLDRARERVYARLEAINDSLAAEGAAASRATDWTFTGKDGKRWGVSPGQIHLGGKTLPLPFNLSPPPDKAKEARDRAGKAGEIGRQADDARTRAAIEEQIKATRAANDKARAAKRDTTKAGGTE